MPNYAQTVPLDRRTFLVTGASRGIGRAIAERLLEAGAAVVALGRDFSAWPEPVDKLEKHVLDLGALDALPSALAALGRSRPDVDGVICNAGQGRFGALEQFSARQLRDMVDVNLTQHLLVARAFLPGLKRRGYGDLVFMGSEAALHGGRNGAVYSACKFALRGLAQALRDECAASGVRVTLVNPGMVDTGFFDQLDFRPGELPEQHIRAGEVAAAVVHALSVPAGTVIDEINLSPLKHVIRFGKQGPG